VHLPAPAAIVPPPVIRRVVQPLKTPHFSAPVAPHFGSHGTVVQLGSQGLDVAEQDPTGGTAGGGFSDTLNATLPLVPVPLWTLALLALAVPLIRIWRTSLQEMFAFDDDLDDDLDVTS
jgi:hypothetical protein